MPGTFHAEFFSRGACFHDYRRRVSMGIFDRRPSKPPPAPAVTPRDPKPQAKPTGDDPLSPFWSSPPPPPVVPSPREPSITPVAPTTSDPPPVREQMARAREAAPTAPEQLRGRAKEPERPSPVIQERRHSAPPPPSSSTAARWVQPSSPESSAPPRMSPVPARASSFPMRGAHAQPDRASSSNPPKNQLAPHASDPVAMMKLARANSDHFAALSMAEAILAREPGHAVALSTAAECRDRLTDAFDRKLGARSRCVRVTVGLAEVQSLGLDPKAAFVLSRIDGMSTIEEILDMSGMPALEAMRFLAELFDRGLAVAEDPPPPSRLPRLARARALRLFPARGVS